MANLTEYTVVIPAYNEEERLQTPLVETLEYFRRKRVDAEVIVVDDGSRDGTARLVRNLTERYPELRLIQLPSNRGKGFAVRTGVVNSRGRYVLFADADGATPIGEVERLRDRLDHGADVAIGSRAVADEETEVEALLFRKIVGRVFHTLVQALTIGSFEDTQCGFKLLGGDVARDLFGRLEMDGFSFDIELLSIALWRGYRVDEVPVNWTHVPGSKVNLATDSLRMLRDLFIIRSRLAQGAYGDRDPHDDAESVSDTAGPTARIYGGG